MRVCLIVIGRMKSGPETELFLRYFDRAKKSGKQTGLHFAELIEHPESKLPTAQERKKEEAEKILASLSSGTTLFCLDEHGENISSKNLSKTIRFLRDEREQELTFVIGGPDGLDQDLLNKAKHVFAFGKVTYPHMIMRILLMEQLYRCVTIETGHPYHRE